jgi:hypothetical protein
MITIWVHRRKLKTFVDWLSYDTQEAPEYFAYQPTEVKSGLYIQMLVTYEEFIRLEDNV